PGADHRHRPRGAARHQPAGRRPAGDDARVGGRAAPARRPARVRRAVAGAAGAPKLGNAGEWAPRIKSGLNALVQSVIKGKGAMPPKAGDTSLTDTEITRAVAFMANQAGAKF